MVAIKTIVLIVIGVLVLAAAIVGGYLAFESYILPYFSDIPISEGDDLALGNFMSRYESIMKDENIVAVYNPQDKYIKLKGDSNFEGKLWFWREDLSKDENTITNTIVVSSSSSGRTVGYLENRKVKIDWNEFLDKESWTHMPSEDAMKRLDGSVFIVDTFYKDLSGEDKEDIEAGEYAKSYPSDCRKDYDFLRSQSNKIVADTFVWDKKIHIQIKGDSKGGRLSLSRPTEGAGTYVNFCINKIQVFKTTFPTSFKEIGAIRNGKVIIFDEFYEAYKHYEQMPSEDAIKKLEGSILLNNNGKWSFFKDE